MRSILVILFLASSYYASAQVNATAVTVSSTCSANGKITVTATGGQPPYIYEIISGPSGFTRPPQNNNVFDFLPPGNYQVEVRDQASGSKTINVTVAGNYKEPTLVSCNIIAGTSTATLVAKDGLPPYKYCYSTDGGNNFTTPQTSNVFNCLPNGNLVFRVIDACDNFYPCFNTVEIYDPYFTPSCTPNSTGGTNITCTPYASPPYYGETPITYTVKNIQGQTFTNTTGVFTAIPGCNFSINAKDKCGRIYDVTNLNCADITLKLGVNCVNYNAGTANIKATAGIPPYKYTETGSGITNTTGNFTGLPKDVGLYFTVEDACGNTRSINSSPPYYYFSAASCPFDGKLELSHNGYRVDSDTCVYYGCNYNFFPVTIQCTNCTPVQTYTLTSPTRFSSISQTFTGLKGGNYNIRVSDQCGNVWNNTKQMDTTNVYVYSYGNYCNTGKIVMATSPDVNNTYKFYQKTPRTLLETNTTGIFTPALYKEYYVVVENPQCKKDSLEILISPSLSASYSCDSVGLTPCPNISGYTYRLYSSTGSLLQTSTSPFFKNLNHGTEYRVVAKNSLFPTDSIQTSFTTYEIAPKYVPYNITCSSFNITQEPYYWYWYDQHGIPLTYKLYNSGGLLLETNEVAGFDTLSAGLYTYKVSHPYCGERQDTVKIDPPAPVNVCLGPSYVINTTGTAYEFAWYVSYGPTSPNIRVKGGPNNINEVYNSYYGNHAFNLLPGKYFIETECSKDTLDLPLYDFKVLAKTSGDCPGFGKIEPSGWPTDPEWTQFLNSKGFDFCPNGGPYYLIYDQNWNQTGQFTNLPSGTIYNVVMAIGAAAPVDTIQVTSPFYARPDLTSTFGVVCTSNPKGTVDLSVQGGTPPYTFEVLSPPLGLSIYTNDTTAQFTDLDAGSYIFRVYDRCGISSDYTASVDILNFTPQYKRICDNNKIKFIAPQISNATYEWRNAANQIVGTTYDPIVNDVGAQTYSVKITTGTCVYNKTFSVPAQTQADVVADAGPDFISFTTNTQLAGITPPAWTQSSWEQIFPSSGATSFNDFTDAQTAIDVSVFPGLYTYVWTVDGGAPGCVDYDTVAVTFYNCDPNLNYTINATGTNSSCTVANGKASVTVTPNTGNYFYTWSNGEITSSIQDLSPGMYIVTVTDDDICTPDQVDTVVIKGTTTINKTVNTSICPGDIYSVGNSSYTTAGTFKDTLKNFVGCDSIITTNLTINPVYNNVVQKDICQGQSFVFNGNTLTTGGTYTGLFNTVKGCDSSVTLNLNVVSQIITNLSPTICSNETYPFDGKLLNQTGTYSDTSLSSIGCDSIAILNLTVNPISVVSVAETICNGETFLFDGKTLSASGIFIDTLQNINNCDSIVTLNLTVLPQIKTQIADKICAGQPYVFGGQNLTASGLYLDTLTSFNNCDSIVELDFTVYPVKSSIVDKSICQGTSFTFDGNVLNASGQFFATFPSVDGCDSSVTLNLTVVSQIITNLSPTICSNETYLFDGNLLNQTGTYSDTSLSSIGCDSIAILNLTVNPVSVVSVSETICNGETFLFDGKTLSASGIFIDTLQNSNNCDSIVTLNLTVLPQIKTQIADKICEGQPYVFGGQNLVASGLYLDTLTSFNNCDSIVELDFTVYPVKSSIVDKSICQGTSFTFDGNVLNASGQFFATFPSVDGCDSSVTLNLNVVSQIINNLFATICSNETYLFDGNLLNQAGTYSDTSLSSIGCDSIAILNLTVNPISIVSVVETICNGETFLFDGKTLSASGIFIDTLQNSNNCDSIVTLNLTVLPQIKTQIADKICAGQPYVFDGQNLVASGLYLDTLTSFNNCDSIVELNFTVYPVKSTIADRIICQGEIFTFDGNNLNASGQYFATFPSVDGCDSSVTLNLTVNAISFTNINDTICANESYSFAGRSLNTSGIYKDTLVNSSGCDSTITLNLKVNELSQTFLKDSFCVGDTFLFGSQIISEGGQYTLNLSNIKGCDSTVTFELLQKSMPVIELGADTFLCRGIAIIIQVNAESGTSILWQDGSTSSQYEINNPGYYAITLSNLCGEYTDSLYVADGCDGCEALIPNAFTPNSDGKNDVFRPILTCSPVELNFSVFNRWGEQVFSSTDANIGWDGTFKSADAMTDAYVWQLSYSYVFDGEVKSKQDRGVVVLIR